MKKIKLILIHLIDKFDNYVLHRLVDWTYYSDSMFSNWVFDTSNKICTKICMSEWWGEEECFCKYCETYKHEDI